MGMSRLIRVALAGLAVCLFGAAGPNGAKAGAQDGATPLARHQPLLQSLESKSGAEQPRVTLAEDGLVTFLGALAGNAFASGAPKNADPAAAATAFLTRWRAHFMTDSAAIGFDVTRVKAAGNRSSVRLGQSYQGLKVYGAEVIVQVGASSGVEMATLDIMRNSSAFDEGKVSLTPTATAMQGADKALSQAAGQHSDDTLTNTTPELMIYDPAAVGEKGPPSLVWVLEVSSVDPGGVKQRMFVDAHSGKVLLQYSLIMHAKNRQIYDSANSSADPGTLVRSDGGGLSEITDADVAYDYFWGADLLLPRKVL
jgi:Zn-dependent metalloprotease